MPAQHGRAIDSPSGSGDDSRAQDPRHRALAQHLSVFRQQVAHARALLGQGRDGAAACYAGIAAKFAASHHPGIFANAELEHLLLTIGRRALRTVNVGNKGRPGGGDPRHILHVLTQVGRVGGHSRMVWRWIQQDLERTHSVVLTRQGAVRVPSMLRDAVAAAGGHFHILDERRGNLLTWAARLRAIAASADMVVLHINPDDVIPIIALADEGRMPPRIYLDHADQLFWVGVGVSDIVAALRASGQRLARERRGVAPARSALLPIPLPPIRRVLSRAEAKAQLGLPADIVLLLSIARPHKYLPCAADAGPGAVGFADALVPVLRQHPRALALVVGPDHVGPWRDAAARADGRLRALGVREDTALLYQAADIYLDSYPIVSITSLLEAGSHGLPLVTRQPAALEAGILGADTPGLTQLVRATGAAEFQAAIGWLIGDAAERARLGAATRRAIEEAHTGEPWRHALHALYHQALALAPAGREPVLVERRPPDEVDLLLPEVFRDEPDLAAIERFHLRLLPGDLRLRRWLAGIREGQTLPPGLLLPEWLGTRLERWRYPHGSDRYPEDNVPFLSLPPAAVARHTADATS